MNAVKKIIIRQCCYTTWYFQRSIKKVFTEEVKSMSDRLTEAMREQENGSKEVLTAIKDTIMRYMQNQGKNKDAYTKI